MLVAVKTSSGVKQDATPYAFKKSPATASSKSFQTVKTESNSAQAVAV